jgi:probable DNA metabolism protein
VAWTQVAYQYDGSFEGFLCCVFESYVNKEFPVAFFSDEECYTLYAVRSVITQQENAKRVMRGIVKRSAAAGDLLRRAFLTCMEDKEIRLYAFVRKVYADGGDFLKNQSDPVYYPVARAVRHMSREVEKLRGFVRFSDYKGVLGAEIEPKNRVLPLLRGHFCNRCANEDFFIYDRTHRELLLYSAGCSRIMAVDNLRLDLPGEEEVHYRALWKRFYESVAIRERLNPRCQNNFLPKRYRGNMTEFRELRYEADPPDRPKAPAALPVLSAPGGKPAPATPR